MHQTHNPIRSFSFRALSLFALAVTLLTMTSMAQTTRRRTYRISSGAVGVTRAQSVHVTLISKNKWFPPCDITPGGSGVIEVTLVDAEGRELARETKGLGACGITSMSVNVADIMQGEGRLNVRAVVKLIESAEPDGAPPALAASIEVSDNATGKTTVLQGFEPQPVPWALNEQ